MVDYSGKKVVIIGLGLTGISCIDFFISRGITPYVMDTRTNPPQLNHKLIANITYHCGSLNREKLLEADLIIASPGIALFNPVLNEARIAGVEVIGDIELFCRENQVPIIAITGSNGKSTVTMLLNEMAQAAGWQVGIGGNIGIPALTLLKQEYQLIVLELSSFQLETTYSLSACAATVLNITEDHNDRYPLGIKQYQTAKLRIYKNAKTCVVNANDTSTIPNFSMSKCTITPQVMLRQAMSKQKKNKQRRNNCWINFGIDVGYYNLNKKNKTLWLQAGKERVLDTKKIKLNGYHNYTNALAALALADAAGIPRSCSLKALTTYQGLSHRFQLVFENRGIRWINDSKATNVGSTKAAINSLQVSGTLHLLLGGDGKSANFSSLTKFLQGDRIRIYCFGYDAQQLAQLRPKISQCANNLQQAMKLIIRKIVSGDVVLLSPACASLDQFHNFEQRGDEFSRLAKELG
ncbi:UDP-N-acetylmuramoyl-L-alanine--D-glutamate ligase [Candidatus Fukatsuia anoeciicola]|uniref:UDP-N-acetylmuramoyl-L-alanine--D-glutamate ligase n=1 Tax=Candidatus Fukatsuia anoeciicola TaxID=2994492 RepID=UPI003463A5E5